MWYPPLATDLTSIITDLKVTTPATTDRNDLLGDVGYNRATGTTDYSYEMIPGTALKEWITWLNSVYTAYNTEKSAYDNENDKWTTYAEYTAPEAGLFGAEDPDAPAAMSAPRKPTQPVEVPSTIANLSDSVTTGGIVYNGKAGYGWPSAYKFVPVGTYTGKNFGTLAGATLNEASTANFMEYNISIRKTSNKDSSTTDGYVATCDTSYLMITAVNKAAYASTKNFILTVTA